MPTGWHGQKGLISTRPTDFINISLHAIQVPTLLVQFSKFLLHLTSFQTWGRDFPKRRVQSESLGVYSTDINTNPHSQVYKRNWKVKVDHRHMHPHPISRRKSTWSLKMLRNTHTGSAIFISRQREQAPWIRREYWSLRKLYNIHGSCNLLSHPHILVGLRILRQTEYRYHFLEE